MTLPSQTKSLEFGENCWQVASEVAIDSIAVFPEAIANLSSAVAEALEHPIGFPALDQAIVSGDQVALAVDPALPSMPEIVAAVVLWICEHGTLPENVRIVIASAEESLRELLRQQLGRVGLESVEVELHDPDDVQGVSYVAANEASDPIYVNRTLVDADVVIPITLARAVGTLDYFGSFSLFAYLTNRDIRGQVLSFQGLSDPERNLKLRKWADEAAWWLGLLVGIQVLPAGRNQIGGVLAGALEALEETVQERWRALAELQSKTGDLVLAVVDGRAAQQDWNHVARALYAGSHRAEQGGAVVVCTDLKTPIGKGLSRLQDIHRSRDAVAKKLAKDASDDALLASVILQATSDQHVYLVSQLRTETVESLGLGVIENEEQLSSLMGQFSRVLLLPSAQYLPG